MAHARARERHSIAAMFAQPVTTAGAAPIFNRRPLVKRGAVTMTLDPIDIRWNNRRVALSPIEAELFALLMRRGRLGWSEVHGTLRDLGCSTDSRDVLIHRIRRKFANVGARDPIETVRGWGIRFQVERDSDGSTAFWIGASEDEPVLP